MQDGYAYNFTVVDDVKVPEAWLHDVRVLPHCVEGKLEATFPRAVAGDEVPETPEVMDDMEKRGTEIGKKRRQYSGARAESPELNMASNRGRSALTSSRCDVAART